MSKRCACCLVSHPVSSFTKDRQKEDGLNSYCRLCLNKKQRERYAAKHGRKNKDRQRLSLDSPADYKKIWVSENLGRARSYYTQYRDTHKEQVRARNMLRYANKKQRAPSWLTKAQRAEMEGMYMFCQLFNGFEVDHVVPLCGKSVSGLHVPWNLQILSAQQNRAKSNIFNPSEHFSQKACASMESQ